MRRPRRQVRVPVAKPAKLGLHPWYWHPDRPQSRKPPEDFVERLQAVHPDFAVSWNPGLERWQLWARAPRIQRPYCQGWKLIAVLEWDGQYVDLDNRVLALAFERTGRRYGSGREYWDRIVAEVERDQAAAKRAHENEIGAGAKEYWDHTRIQVSMFGQSSGSKFAQSHAES